MRTAQAVAAGDYNRGDIFPQQVADLVGLFNGALPDDHIANGVLLQPQIATRPELWMLGSSDFGGLLAAQLGIRFAFAHFINAQYGHRVAEAYRERFTAGNEAAAVSRRRRLRPSAPIPTRKPPRWKKPSICVACRWPMA